jgi:hypothetical protein
MKFDKSSVSIIHEEAVKILQQRLAECGITVEAAGGKYDDHEYTMKLKLSTTNESGQSQAAVDFTRYARRYGLDADQLGSVFTHKGMKYRITGLKPSRRVYPIETKCIRGMDTGKTWFFPEDTVKQALTLARPQYPTRRKAEL